MQIIKEALQVLSLAAFTSFLMMHFNTRRFVNQKKKMLCNVFQTPVGWGYQVVINKKLNIYQAFVPVIETHLGFPTKETAEIAGDMIMDKIKRNENPVLTLNDLTTAGIVIDNALLVGKKELVPTLLN
jgi:hypothetical protein